MTRPNPVSEDRIRECAYRLWLEEGQPHGRDAEHWEKARELLALEAESQEGQEGVGEGNSKPSPWGEPVAEASTLANLSEFPATTDQGEQKSPKKRRPSVTQRPKQRAM